MFRSFLVAVLLLPVVPLAADRPDAPPPAMGRYVMVLWEPGTPVGDRQTRRVAEPDVAALGGQVLFSRDNRRVIHLPLVAAKQLRRHEAVAYLQRLWTGESFEGWDETFPTGSGLDVSSEGDTGLTWGPKAYEYDDSGNITRFGDEYYAYDSAGRLAKVTPITGDFAGKTETYKYDSFGNLVEKAVSGTTPVTTAVDAQSNRMVGATYDLAGNVTTRDGRDAYYWDNVGVLAGAKGKGPVRRILYDVDDERIGTIIDSTLSRWTIRDLEGQIIREFRGETIMETMYWYWEQDHIRGDGTLFAGETQYWTHNNTSSIQYGGPRHYHLDHLGSVRMVTNASGKSLGAHDYFPFGVTRSPTYQEVINPMDPHVDAMRFAGHWRDLLGVPNAENHEYIDYMHARYYDPNLGRFLSVDPTWESADLGKPQSWNRYAYVLNNPVNMTDPDGKLPFLVNLLGELAVDFVVDGNPTGSADLPKSPAQREAHATRMQHWRLEQRAKAIHAALPEATQRRTTTAVAEVTNPDGSKQILVASSEKNLRPAQRAALRPGEVAVSGTGHAEQTIINAAKESGQKVEAVAASRPVCPSCATGIRGAGARAATALKKVAKEIFF